MPDEEFEDVPSMEEEAPPLEEDISEPEVMPVPEDTPEPESTFEEPVADEPPLEEPADVVRVLRLVATGGQRVVLGPEGLSVDGKNLELAVLDNVDYERRRADGQWRTVTCSRAEEGLAERRWRICQSPDLRVRRKLDQTVPEGFVFLLGDNRLHAKDSGDFGAVPKEDLLGRIFQVRYSIDPKSKTLRAERKGIEIP